MGSQFAHDVGLIFQAHLCTTGSDGLNGHNSGGSKVTAQIVRLRLPHLAKVSLAQETLQAYITPLELLELAGQRCLIIVISISIVVGIPLSGLRHGHGLVVVLMVLRVLVVRVIHLVFVIIHLVLGVHLLHRTDGLLIRDADIENLALFGTTSHHIVAHQIEYDGGQRNHAHSHQN